MKRLLFSFGFSHKPAFLIKKLTLLTALSIIAVFMTGCVTGRRVVPLPVAPAAQTMPATKGQIALLTVIDNRHFENKPKEPSTPSIDGDVTKLTEVERASFIGRQRNTFGGAMGDIVLPKGETVPQKMEELVKTAFAKRGYTVVPKGTGTNNLDVVIDEFWAWSTPGFASISFEARVYCTFILRQGGTESKFTIQGYGLDKGQVAKNANWQLAYTRAFDDFLQKLEKELSTRGF